MKSGCQGENGKQAIGGAKSATITIGDGAAFAMATEEDARHRGIVDLVPTIGIADAATGTWLVDSCATGASAECRVLKVSNNPELGKGQTEAAPKAIQRPRHDQTLCDGHGRFACCPLVGRAEYCPFAFRVVHAV